MNPEVFLEQKDISPLTKALSQVFTRVKPLAILEAAGIDNNFIGNLSLNAQPNMFALELVAAFRTYSISRERLDYHPMIKLLQHLCALAATYKLTDEDRALFVRLVERGEENFQALVACSAVGRIESPQDNGIGTGVLVGEKLLLTCSHIFSKTQVQKAWVRFNYKAGKYPLDIDLFELDLNFIEHSHRQDFALVKIEGELKQKIINPNNTPLEREQAIRLIHHPQGKPIEISEQGKIIQVGEDYLYHNLKTTEGSSGAPIVNRQWELIGIHRGNPEISRGRPIVPEVWTRACLARINS
ncbi:MAG: trypsin-like peptidase domain-containing protein [Xenococcaceae cyanobacterium MO_188.B32]|nr:trypsin-like peptidase domain-containing protein [Xenococcaceae cyanobacterium MO_188.B32]